MRDEDHTAHFASATEGELAGRDRPDRRLLHSG
jgi:hypothetical protein